MADFISSDPTSAEQSQGARSEDITYPRLQQDSAETTSSDKNGERVAPRSLHLKKFNNKKPEGDNAGYSCYLSSEDLGGSLRYDFDPDPTSILWGMMANLTQTPTRGGQLVYSSGRLIGPLNIVGYLRSTWDQLDLAEFVQLHMTEAMTKGKPLRFVYPERDIDFSVMIQSFNDIGVNSEDGELKGYSLVCFIAEDNRAIKVVEMTKLGIPENVEWIDPLSAALIAQERFPFLDGMSGMPEEETNPEEEDVTDGGTTSPEEQERVDEEGNPYQGPRSSNPAPIKPPKNVSNGGTEFQAK